MLFDFLYMKDTYEERKVDRYEDGMLMVDTCSVTDGSKNYETAVQHPDYNNNSLVIVEVYDTKKEAKEGHKKWVKIMTLEPLPESLSDCCNAEVAQLLDMTGKRFPRRRKENSHGR